MRCRIGGILLVAVLLALVTGCSGDDSPGGSGGSEQAGGGDEVAEEQPAVVAEEYTGDDFYAPPDPLPDGDHGTLLRYQPVEGYDVDGATAWRVMYLSESVAGDPIAVTGSVLVPTGPAPD